MDMQGPDMRNVGEDDVTQTLAGVAARTGAWLRGRRAPDGPGFSLCDGAFAPVELNATTGGVELWVMLGLPLPEQTRAAWIAHLRGYQNSETGLVIDPTWVGRQLREDPAQLAEGDSFFTMTAMAALDALGAGFEHPVSYLVGMAPARLAERSCFERIAHHPMGIGDFGRLVRHNRALGVAGAEEQWQALLAGVAAHQDPSGLWPVGSGTPPLTPAVNRAFHVLRSSWALSGHEMLRPAQMIDACLAASGDQDFYSWSTGYACNDLDLAHVLYSALHWSAHRRDEVAVWARQMLGTMLAVEKPGGGFSFFHETAMVDHGGLKMSEGRAEADTWGTLMYLGAIKMMAEIGWPGVRAPWALSRVHAVTVQKEEETR